MANADQMEVLRRGATDFNRWRQQHPNEAIDLEKAHLADAQLDNVNLEGANLSRANLSGSSLKSANLDSANLEEATLNSRDGSGADLTGAVLRGAKLKYANLNGACLRNCQLNYANLYSAELQGVQLQGATLIEANLENADLRAARLHDADLRGASLASANLLGAVANSETRLEKAVVLHARIDRLMLEQLREYGGLSRAELGSAEIHDDVALFRQAFSGFWTLIHAVALTIFLAPYAWFLIKSYLRARFVTTDSDDPTILAALCRFVYSGGREWRHDWLFSWTFPVFIVLLGYNFVRATMLWKTKTLELRQQVTGFPVLFSMRAETRLGIPWSAWYWASTVGFYINVTMVSLHSLSFLLMRVS